MNDRELLEFAAKAANIKKPHLIDDSGFIYWHLSDRDCETCTVWNPLENDGDALRLAVQLQLTICNEHINAGVAYCTNGDTDYPFVESGGKSATVIDGDFAATRRAIVRAAAEIGRAK